MVTETQMFIIFAIGTSGRQTVAMRPCWRRLRTLLS